MESIDVLVVGGGVTGLASAHAVARRGRSVAVLEQHARFGAETSTHNSGVIHAGLYYPTGSAESTLCVEGAPLLYEFCAAHRVPHARCGKLVVAPTTGCPRARGAHGSARPTASRGSRWSTGVRRRREPHVAAAAAIWSPDTGIVDAEALVRAAAASCDDRRIACSPGRVSSAAERVDGDRSCGPARRNLAARSSTRRGCTPTRCRAAWAATVPNLSVPRRVCGARAGAQELVRGSRVSPAASKGPRPRRPS